MKVREVVRIIEQDGWYLARMGKGDHKIYKHPTKPGIVIIDGKPGWEVPIGTLHSVWKQAGIVRTDLR